MIINRLTATFGKLENRSLALREGLNVIYAPNESGKSTWCAFIRAMLYGIDSSERARVGHLPDKQKYAPWSGAPMRGSMELSSGQGEISIRRDTRLRNAPMREFSACYTGSAVPVEGMDGNNAGELLTGVSRDVFMHSAFIAQGSVAITDNGELEKRISAIVTSGEEETSFSEAEERLNSWLRRRRGKGRGLLPELEEAMDETRRRLYSAQTSFDSLSEAEAELEKAMLDYRALEERVSEERKSQRLDLLRRLSEGRAELKEREKAQDEAYSTCKLCRESLEDSPFSPLSEEEAERAAETDMELLRNADAGKGFRFFPLLSLLFFLLALASAAAYASTAGVTASILAVCLGLFCALTLICLLLALKQKRESDGRSTLRKRIMHKYGISNPKGILLCLEEYLGRWEALRNAERSAALLLEEYEQAEEEYSALEREAVTLLDFSRANNELTGKLSSAGERVRELGARVSALKGSIAVSGDPMVLESELADMSERYEQISGEFEAISIALKALREADAEIQSRFSPALGRLAAEYMSSITQGRYEDVLINRDFSALTKTADDSIARESDYLSRGTLDLMYIAVRLAVCELALPEGERCPLIIDDAFVNLDERRYAQAMELLKKIAKKRQVIFFTCRSQ